MMICYSIMYFMVGCIASTTGLVAIKLFIVNIIVSTTYSWSNDHSIESKYWDGKNTQKKQVLYKF
jgi:hypothetical protein